MSKKFPVRNLSKLRIEMAKNEKLYLALLVAFAVGDNHESSNEECAAACSDVLSALVDEFAAAVMAALPPTSTAGNAQYAVNVGADGYVAGIGRVS